MWPPADKVPPLSRSVKVPGVTPLPAIGTDWRFATTEAATRMRCPPPSRRMRNAPRGARQHHLRRIGGESGLRVAASQGAPKVTERSGRNGSGISQSRLQVLQRPAAAVDRAGAAGLLNEVEVVGCGQQAVDVECRHTLKAHQQAVRAQIGRQIPLFATEGRKRRDVDLVGGWRQPGTRAQGDEAAPPTQALHWAGDAVIGHQAFERAQANAVVGGDEIEVGGPGWRWRKRPGLGREGRRIAEGVAVQEQRRQAELIDHVRFVAVAEVADVLPMGHIGFGDQL